MPGNRSKKHRSFCYRVTQAVRAVRARVAETEYAQAQALLTPQESALFAGMDVVDQRHAIDVLKHVQSLDLDDKTLHKAALLHDCGKVRGEFSLWGRIFAVMTQAVAPAWAEETGCESDAHDSRFWRRWLAVSFQHGEMGARRLEQFCDDPELVWLVRNHHAEKSDCADCPERSARLRMLQEADDRS